MTKKLAFLGYGLRSKTMLQAFREIEADISVAAVADPRWEQIKEENAGDPLFAEARYFENADALLGGCEPDGVFIGTRCPLHTPLAVEVLKRDIPLFLGLGLGSVLFFTVCYFKSIEMLPLSIAAILLYTSPIWVTLMSVLFFKERLTLRRVAALVLAFGGCLPVSYTHLTLPTNSRV